MVHQINRGAVGLYHQFKAQVIGHLHDATMLGLGIAMGQGWIHAQAVKGQRSD